MRFTFGGQAVTNYPQYLDLGTGGSLVAEPGETYDVAPAAGHTWAADGKDIDPPMPPDDRWAAVKAPTAKTPKESS